MRLSGARNRWGSPAVRPTFACRSHFRRRDEIFSRGKKVHTRLSKIDKQLEIADMEPGKRHRLEEERRGLKEEQPRLGDMVDTWVSEFRRGEDTDDRMRRVGRMFKRMATKQAKQTGHAQ